MKKVIVIVCAVVIAIATVFIVRGSGNDGCRRAMAQAAQNPNLISNPLVLSCAQWQALGFCPKPDDPRPCREIMNAGECPLYILAENFPTSCSEWQAINMCPVRWTCAPWLALEICPRDTEGIRCSQLIAEDRCPIRWTCTPIIEKNMCPVFAPGRERRTQ